MAPVTQVHGSQTSPQTQPPLLIQQWCPTDSPPAATGPVNSATHTGVVSPSILPDPQAWQTRAPQPSMLPASSQHYTQCSAAFPGLLRAASDPYLQEQTPLFPTPSALSQDFPPLPGPAYPPVEVRPESGDDNGILWAMAASSPPPKAQRLSRSRDPSVSKQLPAPNPTYAQKCGLNCGNPQYPITPIV